MRAVILAGGRGTRLWPYTRVLPKPLIPLDDTPILEILLQQLRRAGVDHVTLSVSYKADQIERYFGDGERLGFRLEYSRCDIPLGTAGPLALIDRPESPCIVLNGDLLTTVDFQDVFDAHCSDTAAATLVLYRHTIHLGFGVAELDGNQGLARLREKPSFEFLINAGIYVLSPSMWEHLMPGHFLDMPDLLENAVAAQQRVASYQFEGEWLDIGTTEQYHRADELFRGNRALFLPDASVERMPAVAAGM